MTSPSESKRCNRCYKIRITKSHSIVYFFFQFQQVLLVHSYVPVKMVVNVQWLALKYVHVQMVLLVVFVNVYYVNIIYLFLKRKYYRFRFLIILATDGCGQIQCLNGGTCLENIPGSSVVAYCTCKHGYTGKMCETG